jgi:hypothetical protein
MKVVKINKVVSMYQRPALGTVKEGDTRYMALSIDRKSKNPYIGVAREITKSKGNVNIPGYVDESKLIAIESKEALVWKKKADLKIKGIEKIIKKISGKNKFFIGLEDPDIWQDEKGIEHVYFTIAFKYKKKAGFEVYLGHAHGKNLNNMTATAPVMCPIIKKRIRGFKEVSISIPNKKGYRINLAEAIIFRKGREVSAIAATKAEDMSKSWESLRIALDPKKMKYSWCKGHLSSCCFLPKEFIIQKEFIINNEFLIGVVNGREPEKTINGQRVFGKFRPGLILFNPQTGEIPWLSPKPLFEDPDARTITFASDFVHTKKQEGILYAHVNDSFVRAYKINVKELKKLLPENLI